MQHEILIVGAGPAGLMAACQLAMLGVKFRIIDKNKKRVQESRALAVQARTLEIFASMDLAKEALARGRVIESLSSRPFGKKIKINFDCLVGKTPYPYILMLPQSATEALLEEKLTSLGFLVERETELINLVQNEMVVSCQIKHLAKNNSEQVDFLYVLGTDGAHSTVRHALNVNFVGAPYAQHFWLADLTVANWSVTQTQLTIFVQLDKILGVFPLPEKNCFRLVGKQAANKTAAPSLQEIENYVRKVTQENVHCEQARWVVAFHLHHRLVDKMQIGAVFLLGDAAHIHSPVGGQGMNTGIQDAFNLCWKLSLVLKKQMATKILTSYHLERHPVGEVLLKKSDRLFQLVSADSLLYKLFKVIFFNMLAFSVKHFSMLANQLIWFVSQLKIKYHQGLVFETKNKIKPGSGERAPWGQIYDAQGTTISLFSLFVTGKHSLFIFSKQIDQHFLAELKEINLGENVQIAVMSKNKLLEKNSYIADKALFDTYHVIDQSMIFIRPDGYIATRFEHTNLTELIAFLQNYFLS